MNYFTFVHLFHIIFVGGLFLYVGIKRTQIPKLLYPFLLVLGIVIIFYHSYKAYNYFKSSKPYWFNLIHIFIIGPILINIGFYKENTKRPYFDILLMLAFASIGYHAYQLF